MASLQSLPVEKVFPNPKQPRKQFDQKDLEELAGSILANGLAQPIKVAPRAEGFMIVMGERRWRAHQIAGLAEIVALVEDLSDKQITDLAMIENINRKDMNPMETACGFREMMAFDRTEAEVAAICGYDSDTDVKDYLALLALGPHIQLAVRSGILPFQHARQIAYLDPEDQDRIFSGFTSNKFPTLRKLKAAVVAAWDASRQTNFFNDGTDLTSRDRKALSKVDTFLDGADRLLAGMTDEDFQIIRMTAKSDAPRCVDKIKLLESYCGRLRRALETSIARAEHLEAA